MVVLRIELISNIEKRLQESSPQAIAVVPNIDKELRDDLLKYFKDIESYHINEEITINTQHPSEEPRYKLFIKRRN